MNIANRFEFAGATIRGKDHRMTDSNNQDAFHIDTNDSCVALAVCDGCGSESQSDVGAKFGVRWVTSIASRLAADLLIAGDMERVPQFLEELRTALLSRIRDAAEHLGGTFDETIERYFLFTIVAAVLTRTTSVFFALGDGVVAIDGDIEFLSPLSGNRPAYLAYALSPRKGIAASDLRFQVIRTIPTERLTSFMIGTDGVRDLVEAADRFLPGKTQPLGPLEQFWNEDRYFANPDALRRRLFLANREARRIDWLKREMMVENGLLPDDTTLIVGRRRKEGV